MLRIESVNRTVVILACVALWAIGTAAQTKNGDKSSAAKPPIEITTIPPAGAGPDRQELIAGRVNISKPGDYKVCIFSHTDRWYVQPYAVAFLTDVNPSDGHWQTRIHLGDEYAALLVRPSYSAAATMLELPKIGGDIVAIARETARK